MQICRVVERTGDGARGDIALALQVQLRTSLHRRTLDVALVATLGLLRLGIEREFLVICIIGHLPSIADFDLFSHIRGIWYTARMPRKHLHIIVILIVAAVLIMLWKDVTVAPGPQTETPVTREPIDDVQQVAGIVVTMLQNRDYQTLAGFVDPDAGLTFYPYTYIDPEAEAVNFPADMIPLLPTLSSTRIWGLADGSGEPIDLPVEWYMQRFVADRNYLATTDVRINDEAQAGNTPNNVVASFPNATVVSYHVPATEEGGMDWSALRLVFVQKDGTWYLQAIVHDAWTI